MAASVVCAQLVGAAVVERAVVLVREVVLEGEVVPEREVVVVPDVVVMRDVVALEGVGAALVRGGVVPARLDCDEAATVVVLVWVTTSVPPAEQEASISRDRPTAARRMVRQISRVLGGFR